MKWLLSLMLLGLVNCSGLPSTSIADATGSRAIAVFDIDGTLTPRNARIFTARPYAAESARTLSEKGYRIVYLTARWPGLQEPIASWLKRNGFPDGDLQYAPDVAANKDPEPFKLRILKSYLDRSWHVAYAFGDSSSDFQAYADAGVSKDNVFALRRSNQAACLPGIYARCISDWHEILPLLRSIPKLNP